MASWRGHLTFSTGLGAAYGGLAFTQLGVDWPSAAVAAGFTALGGLLPDLDSDSGVPVRELFNLAAVAVPLALLRRAADWQLDPEQTLLVFAGTYAFVRYGVRAVFRQFTVHRGMFHSVPAMVIVGLLVFLGYKLPSLAERAFLATGAMLGFLSHLVLDELCSVDLSGLVPKLKGSAGSALKMVGPSWPVNLLTYAALLALAYPAWQEVQVAQSVPPPLARQPLRFEDRPKPSPSESPRWRPASPTAAVPGQ
jgi:hypothetical protein